MNRSHFNANYRSDIDGLRALAVLSVIIFHINGSLLSGGYVGVDIFFVISGYLISLHIFKDLQLQRFSLLEFYKRRVKRIAPALLVVIAVVLLVTQLIYRPHDAERAAESGFWSLMSLANVYFWLFQDNGYFATSSNELPLLHLWSLGVEEQFYIFWPLILLAARRIVHKPQFFIVFAVVALASFILGNLLFGRDPSFVYYMLPTRAGELLVGALLAHYLYHRADKSLSNPWLARSAWLGLGLLIAPLFLYTDEMVFPGLWAVPPTIGAALLILAGNHKTSLPIRMLSWQPLVWIGIISYSAYLWHWPILSYLRYIRYDIDLFTGVVILAVVLLLAWISYRYVETPARRSTLSAYRVIWKQYVLPGGVIGVVALVSMKVDGYGLRWFFGNYKEQVAAVNEEVKIAYDYDYVCQRALITKHDADNPNCVLGDSNITQTKAILLGDSNAAHYVGMLGEFAERGGFRFRNLAVNSCPPLLKDVSGFTLSRRYRDCQASQHVFRSSESDYPVVVLATSWTTYVKRSNDFLTDTFDMVRQLVAKGKLVILLGKVPVVDNYDRYCREKAISIPFLQCDRTHFTLSQDVVEVNTKLKEFADKTKNVEYFDLTGFLCRDKRCSLVDTDGEVRYYNASHLALKASWRIGEEIFKERGIPFPFTLIPNWSGSLAIK